MVDTFSISDLVPLLDFIFCKCWVNSIVIYIAAIYILSDISSCDTELFLDAVEQLFVGKPVHNFSSFCQLANFTQDNNITNVNNKLLDLVLANFDSKIEVRRTASTRRRASSSTFEYF